MTECLLWGYGRCQGQLQGHHWMSKAPYRKNKAARKYIEKHRWFFVVDVCMAHNVERIADTKWARRVILASLVARYGEDTCRQMLEGIPFKGEYHDLQFDGIMAAEMPDRWEA